MIEWRGHTRIACPALSTVQLTRDLGGNAIDEALRRGAAALPQMWEVLEVMPGLHGNVEARRLLHESRDRPWSELERRAHVLLRAARIKGWETNLPVRVAGFNFFLDVGFRGRKLAIELDGYEVHLRRDVFITDRERQNLLALAGWKVLRYTSASLTSLVAQVRTALE